MPTLGNALDFSKYEARQLRAHILGAAPSSPVTGQLYYNSGDNTLYWWDGTIWQSGKGGGATGAAGGDLSGTYPNPQIAAGVITDADVNAANKDGLAAVASLRTLGTGAQQAASGTDARFTNARAPTAHATTHQPGGSDAMAVDQAAATASLRTLGTLSTQAMAGNRSLDSISPPLAPLNLNNFRITGLADPAGNLDGANKQYVDNLVQGISPKTSVRAASTANLTLSGTQTIDGVAVVVGNRVLVKDQTTPAQNGIYDVASGAWTRSVDADIWTELVSAYTWIEQGTAQADTGWLSTVDQGGTLGTTAVTWTQFSGAGQVIAGAGLTKTGNSLDVGAAAGITVAADTVGVATGGVTNAMLAGAIDATTKLTGAVPVANGGTSQTTAKAARETGLAASGYYSSATHGAGATITITQATHLLRASRGIQVQVQDEATGAVEYPDIVVAATGDVTVTYGASQTANTKRVTLVG